MFSDFDNPRAREYSDADRAEVTRRASRYRRRRRGFASGSALAAAVAVATALATVSGGGHQVRVSSPVPTTVPSGSALGSGGTVSSGRLAALQMLSSTDGVALAAARISPFTPSASKWVQLAITADGGRSWRLTGQRLTARQPLGITPSLPGGGLLAFATPTVGYLLAGNLYRTSDTGKTWQRVPPSDYSTTGGQANGVVASGNRVWVLSCVDPACSHDFVATTQAGTNRWTVHSAPAADVQLAGVPSGDSLVIDAGNRAWRSSDLGARWTEVRNPYSTPVIAPYATTLFSTSSFDRNVGAGTPPSSSSHVRSSR